MARHILWYPSSIYIIHYFYEMSSRLKVDCYSALIGIYTFVLLWYTILKLDSFESEKLLRIGNCSLSPVTFLLLSKITQF